jgi:hypothetical protein
MALENQSLDNKRVFSGPGYIKQSSDGKVHFKLYPEDKSGSQGMIEEFLSQRRVKLGALIPEHEYYFLSATDLRGRQWNSRWVAPPSIYFDEVVTGQLDELVHTASGIPHKRGYLVLRVRKKITPRNLAVFPWEMRELILLRTLRVYDDVKIPINAVTETEISVAGKKLKSSRANASSFTSCNNTFRLTQEDGLLTIEVISEDESLPDPIEKRVIEALQFVLARPLWWLVMQRWSDGVETTCIRPRRAGVSKPRLQPPIHFHGYGYEVIDGVWSLFDKYLQYIITHPEDKWHPLSARLHSVCEASGGSLDAEGLTLGIAVEGVLKSEFSDLGSPSEGTISAINDFLEYMNAWSGDESLKRRIKGAVGTMHHPRAKDRMRVLIDEGAVTREQLRAWENLRHASAHAERADARPVEDYIRLCDKVIVLLYHLVFRAIGYEGKYTDYSTEGWPLREYPQSTMDT